MDKLPQRKNVRLKNYDYSQAGYYFVTICTKDKQGLFGHIAVGDDDSVIPDAPRQPRIDRVVDPYAATTPNEIGNIILECWNKINDLYDNVTTDSFCLMPNHIHGIIIISERSGGESPSLSKIIQGFKSVSTRMCFKYDHKTIWQRNYHEHVIRDQEDYERINEYIETNPMKWKEDKYYML